MSMDISHVGHDLSREERETIISRADDQDTWCIVTFSPAMARRLVKVASTMGIEIEQFGSNGIRCFLPRGCVNPRALLEISPEERTRRAERLARTRAEVA